MATAKEKREAQEREREERRLVEEAEALRQWPRRLMQNLERASKLGLSIVVEETKFTVSETKFTVSGYIRWNDSVVYRFAYLPTTPYDQYYIESDWEHMNALEHHMDKMEEANREEQRKREAKVRALTKLSDEDKEALGL